MKILRSTPFDTSIERKILTGLIVNDQFCESILPRLKQARKPFPKGFTNQLVLWIVEYWEKYHKAPKKTIQNIYEEKKSEIDPSIAEAIEEFLNSISIEHESKEDFDAGYEVDEAIRYLKLAKLDNLRLELTKCIAGERIDDGKQLIDEFKLIEFAENVDEPKIISLKELAEKEVSTNIKWIVEDVIPIGLTLFAGKPKTGKSSFILNLAIDVACGRKAFDEIPTSEPMRVLYLALEDSEQRIRSRQKGILKNYNVPENCGIFTQSQGSWPKIGQGGMQNLDKYMIEHLDTKLIIIDTLQKIIDTRRRDAGRSYGDDYRSLEPLHVFATKHEVAIVVIHHTRKTKGVDVFEEISGTTGLAAAADTLMVMSRSAEGKERILEIRGRDFEDKKYIFALEDNHRWQIKGDTPELLVSKQRRAIVQYLNFFMLPVQRKDLVEKMEHKVGQGVDVLVKKLLDEDIIEKIERGVYAHKGFIRALHHEETSHKVRQTMNKRGRISFM